MTPELPESEAFVLLSQRRRRTAIEILQESEVPITVTELAKRIGNRERENPSADAIQSVYLALYHNHLPRLEEADVVEYDEDVGAVHPGVNFDTLFRILETVDETDLPWSDE